jgi:PAS domain-containing protein
LERVATETNRLLDEACASAQRADQRIHQLDRAALLALMDQSPQPILLVHPELGVLAANRAGLRLSEDERAAALSMTPPWAPTPLAGQAGVLMTRGSAG